METPSSSNPDGIILQGFYWNVPQGWYSKIAELIPAISKSGFDIIWLPPPSKAMKGSKSMGYTPYDYYDLGEYNQNGSVETRFGSKEQLNSLINSITRNNMDAMVDLVINHCAGGKKEWNPNTESETFTDFSAIQSRKFIRSYNHFHPSTYAEKDTGVFSDFPDLAHKHPEVWEELIKWGKWLCDEIGFSHFRFDYVKGYQGGFVADWMEKIGGFGVAEYFDGDRELILKWLEQSRWRVAAFDFPLYFTLRDMSESPETFDMRNLVSAGILDISPAHTVKFVSNHDTNEIYHLKEMAYAYIILTEGMSCIFWRDYFDWGFREVIDQLIKIRKLHGLGSTEILHIADKTLVLKREGKNTSGLILAMNIDIEGHEVEFDCKLNVNFVEFRYSDDILGKNGAKCKIIIPPRDYRLWIPVK